MIMLSLTLSKLNSALGVGRITAHLSVTRGGEMVTCIYSKMSDRTKEYLGAVYKFELPYTCDE
jgi:hypothetical protein